MSFKTDLKLIGKAVKITTKAAADIYNEVIPSYAPIKVVVKTIKKLF